VLGGPFEAVGRRDQVGVRAHRMFQKILKVHNEAAFPVKGPSAKLAPPRRISCYGTGMDRAPVQIAASDGWILRGEWLVPSAPRAVAVVGHAMMVDRRTLDRPRGAGLVSLLVERGVAVLWPDLRGHGASGPRAEAGGDWSYDDLVADVPVLLAAAHAKFPSLARFAIGHSLFGHVTLAHLARHRDERLEGLVMLACNVCNPSWGRRRLAHLRPGLLIEAMNASARLIGRVPIRQLGVGTDDEARSYVADFTRGWRSASWRARDGFDWFRALPSVTTRVLAVVGAGDRLYCPPEDARALVAPLPNARFEIVGRRSGLEIDPGHMQLVLDERCRPVWSQVAGFVTAAAR
jgi:pimeloyl-ACP methyl ester carboxylesterase